MHTTFTINAKQLAAIVAKTLGCQSDQVQFTDDTQGDGVEATIVTTDPGAPKKAADMFKRWEAKAASPNAN